MLKFKDILIFIFIFIFILIFLAIAYGLNLITIIIILVLLILGVVLLLRKVFFNKQADTMNKIYGLPLLLIFLSLLSVPLLFMIDAIFDPSTSYNGPVPFGGMSDFDWFIFKYIIDILPVILIIMVAIQIVFWIIKIIQKIKK